MTWLDEPQDSVKGDGSMRMILATCNATEAESLGRRMVEERWVGCVNIFPGVRSIYRWEDEVRSEEEVFLVMETSESRAKAAMRRLRELHSYSVPKIILVDPEACDAEYRIWLEDVTSEPTSER